VRHRRRGTPWCSRWLRAPCWGPPRAESSFATDVSHVVAAEFAVEHDINEEVCITSDLDVLEHQVSPCSHCRTCLNDI